MFQSNMVQAGFAQVRDSTVGLDPLTSHLGNITAGDLIGPIQQPGQMTTPPNTTEVDAAGARSITMEHQDPLGSVAGGTQAVRLDTEISTDGGATWQMLGRDTFGAGTNPGRCPKHRLQIRAMPAALTFPAGTRFRFHWRQQQTGQIGFSVHVDR